MLLSGMSMIDQSVVIVFVVNVVRHTVSLSLELGSLQPCGNGDDGATAKVMTHDTADDETCILRTKWLATTGSACPEQIVHLCYSTWEETGCRDIQSQSVGNNTPMFRGRLMSRGTRRIVRFA